ncbi:DUF2281 domain-containing protein [Sunxiuqinia dokdonensis]|uniref:DUF2281 domain-containing protein n=1 Tax=Sunxiuqinia dokdonensis TaxID=1409788 RepID=A0A0L8V803_9BACT|nr:DUF2281 domain-containing protein [Sunxiuqinia dokdonensis]KOH44488.1 hypothetical protein NC99_27180 [Sunxiuqinia dokdonensis]
MTTIKKIETKINQLTPDLIDELDHYLDYLINKRVAKKSRKLTQNWAGGLKGESYNSIELQKKALDWRQK